MSLTVTSNSLAQQQALQAQTAATQASTASSTSSSDSSSSTSSTTSSDPAATVISGNATLTSDLLSVLLNEQSGLTDSSSGSSGSGDLTLAGILDEQDTAEQDGLDGTTDPTDALFTDLTDNATGTDSTTGTDAATALDATSAAQSATATDSVLSGTQDLLAQLSL